MDKKHKDLYIIAVLDFIAHPTRKRIPRKTAAAAAIYLTEILGCEREVEMYIRGLKEKSAPHSGTPLSSTHTLLNDDFL